MHLLSIEWLKIKKYKTFWVLAGLFILILPLWNYGISDGFLKVSSSSKDGGGVDIFKQAYTFDHVWENMGWWGSLFVIFTTVLAIILATNEYSFKTQRQNLIDGWTRMQVLHAKWLLIITLAVFTTLYVFLIGIMFGLANSSWAEFPGDIENLFYFFILTLNYYTFGLLIATLMKRSGLAIGLFFLYVMFVEKLIQSLGNWLLHSEYLNLLPLQTSDELLPMPFLKVAKAMMAGNEPPPITNTTYVIVSLVWIIIYYLICRFRLQRSDW